MANKVDTSWQVHPHDPILELAPNLQQVTGDIPGMALRRIMTLVRMQDGRLLVHNPIALEDAYMAELERWAGAPAFVVVPNGWHRIDCAAFKRRYPEAKIVCPRGSVKKVRQRVAVDITYDAFPSDDTVEFAHVSGLRDVEGVMLVRSEDGVTLVFNDLIFNQPHLPGVGGVVIRLLGSSGEAKVTRIMRLLAVKDRAATREHLRALAETPRLRRIVPGHGRIISKDAAQVLRGIADKL
ncbi:hypothetical protein [Haliangium ochraceum]|uniref:DUF4336 domain-containing protein n=1 Tax=Haliangium ochraceum (strain DSM 14365 / JCM 11303 / SMP-2) TaxID=502025 RepID=D0LU33_HALO1|nr:hypothetical protein [Haliangium ochraceum]ACY17397.1 conserved hypothetical protein [Haliangium ochraceum DSM 14365]